MAWDKRGYYYRSKKVNGKVQREYHGKGHLAELLAQMDEIERQQRQAEQEQWKSEKSEMEALDEQISQLDEFADLITSVTMFAAGFHQHNRGEWRRKRNAKNDEE